MAAQQMPRTRAAARAPWGAFDDELAGDELGQGGEHAEDQPRFCLWVGTGRS